LAFRLILLPDLLRCRPLTGSSQTHDITNLRHRRRLGTDNNLSLWPINRREHEFQFLDMRRARLRKGRFQVNKILLPSFHWTMDTLDTR
jgi:hypothetical protein